MVKVLFSLFWIATLCAVCIASKCSTHRDCTSCASDTSWSGNACRWCEKTRTCHEQGSVLNNCTVLESMTNPALCTCTKQPGVGVDSTVCSWYSAGSPSPSADPSQWGGGDFLPFSYSSAAQCACVGGQSQWLWNTPVAKCVRRMVLQGHITLPPETKRILRAITVTGDYTKFVGMFKRIHIEAYEQCGCPGSAAGFFAWEAILTLGHFVPCELLIKGILLSGRCGCGW